MSSKRVSTALVQRLVGNPLVRRVSGGAGANLLGKVWVLVAQLATVPILTTHWGVEGYGLWLMLTTIPTYVALSDLGLGTAAAVDMTSSVARGDTSNARVVFQSSWVFLSAVSLFAAGSIVAVSYVLAEDLFAVIAVICAYAVAVLQMNLINGAFRSVQRYALGTFLYDLLYPIETCALVIIVLRGGQIFDVALGWSIVRIIGSFLYYLILTKVAPWALLGVFSFRLSALRRLSGPAGAALALTVANATALQGVVLTLGWVAGAVWVALYGPVRLLARIPLQFSGILSRATIPEMTYCIETKDENTASRIMIANIIFVLLITIPYGGLLSLFGNYFLDVLSAGNLEAPVWAFVGMSIASTANAIWNTVSLPLVASNRQSLFSYWYLAVAVLLALVPLAAPDHAFALAIAAAGLGEVALLMLVLVKLRSTNLFSRNVGDV